jgi:hypothetical protein
MGQVQRPVQRIVWQANLALLCGVGSKPHRPAAKIGQTEIGVRPIMSHHDHTSHSPAHDQEQDPMKAIMPLIPIVLPVVGGVLIFLLAFIAVAMA